MNFKEELRRSALEDREPVLDVSPEAFREMVGYLVIDYPFFDSLASPVDQVRTFFLIVAEI